MLPGRGVKKISFDDMMMNSKAFITPQKSASASTAKSPRRGGGGGAGEAMATATSGAAWGAGAENKINCSTGFVELAALDPDAYTHTHTHARRAEPSRSGGRGNANKLAKGAVVHCLDSNDSGEEAEAEAEALFDDKPRYSTDADADADADAQEGEGAGTSAGSFEDLDLPAVLVDRMFDHQREGIAWLYRLHQSRRHSGGILGDDMGLGKTFQTVALLTALLRAKALRTVLLVVPVAVVHSWHRELSEHLLPNVSRRVQVQLATGEVGIPKRKRILEEARARAGRAKAAPTIIISTYTVVAKMADYFAGDSDAITTTTTEFAAHDDHSNSSSGGSGGGAAWLWDYVILDEGHCIKNPSTQMSKAVHRLRSRKRLVLTGTPIQNNLLEFWTLLNWASAGRLIGTRNAFSRNYMEPIVKGQDPDSSEWVREEAVKAAGKLTALVAPVILQRKKEIVMQQEQEQREEEQQQQQQREATATAGGSNASGEVSSPPRQGNTITLSLPEKVEHAVWIPMASQQRLDYSQYLETRAVSNALDRKHYPVEQINHLKTMCRHPFLVEAGAALKKAGRKADALEDPTAPAAVDDLDSMMNRLTVSATSSSSSGSGSGSNGAPARISSLASVFEVAGRQPTAAELLGQSRKLQVLLELCVRLRSAGHRILIFSQSRMMADIIERVVESRGLVCARIDGRVTGKDRQHIIDSFNRPVSDEEQRQDLEMQQAFELEQEQLRQEQQVQLAEEDRSGGCGSSGGSSSGGSSSDTDKGCSCYRSCNLLHRHKLPTQTRAPHSIFAHTYTESKKSSRRPHIAVLTTKACGTGITLTGADRVILHDPSWNPAEDRQAVDRAYRIGQTRPVVVYRLILASTVEEKMYEKQVFKDGVRVVLEQGKHAPQSQSRYFSAEHTRELFTLGPENSSTVLTKLWYSAGERVVSLEDAGGVVPGVLGYSRHDRLYDESKYRAASEDHDTNSQGGRSNSDSDGSSDVPSASRRMAGRILASGTRRSPCCSLAGGDGDDVAAMSTSPSRPRVRATALPHVFFNSFSREELLEERNQRRQQEALQEAERQEKRDREIKIEMDQEREMQQLRQRYHESKRRRSAKQKGKETVDLTAIETPEMLTVATVTTSAIGTVTDTVAHTAATMMGMEESWTFEPDEASQLQDTDEEEEEKKKDEKLNFAQEPQEEPLLDTPIEIEIVAISHSTEYDLMSEEEEQRATKQPASQEFQFDLTVASDDEEEEEEEEVQSLQNMHPCTERATESTHMSQQSIEYDGGDDSNLEENEGDEWSDVEGFIMDDSSTERRVADPLNKRIKGQQQEEEEGEEEEEEGSDSSGSDTVVTPVRMNATSSTHSSPLTAGSLTPLCVTPGRDKSRRRDIRKNVICSDSEEYDNSDSLGKLLGLDRSSADPERDSFASPASVLEISSPCQEADGYNTELCGFDNFIAGVDAPSSAVPPQDEGEDEEADMLMRMAAEVEELFAATPTPSVPILRAAKEEESSVSSKGALLLSASPVHKWYNAPFSRLVNTAGFVELEPVQSATAPNLVCYHPAHAVADSTAAAAYNELVEQAQFTRMHQQAPKEPDESCGEIDDMACLELEAAILCSLMEICDEDVGVHGRLAELQDELQRLE